MKAFYSFVERLLPSTPGTGNYAFEPRFGLPGQTIGGAGVSVSGALDVFPAEQPYYGQAQTFIGLEGLEFEQVESSQLYDLNALYDQLAQGQ
jgi:hypothetical protein